MDEDPLPVLPPGTRLADRFVVRRCLGAGKFGTVYLADQVVFNLMLRQVALKLFHGVLVTPANAHEHLNDAVVLMRLRQEETQGERDRDGSGHLVTVLDAGYVEEISLPGGQMAPAGEGDKTQKLAFVAMEYVAGYRLPNGATAYTLRDMIRAFRPVPVDLALHWMTQVLLGVAWMHTRQPPVLHCDLKSDNILADGPDALRVADFGLAQLAFRTVGLRGGAGALACQAPETLAGVEPTPASDVYSLGLLMHEILAGENPLASTILAEAAAEGTADDRAGRPTRHIEARRAGIARLTEADNPDLAEHPTVSEIVARCLRFRATERYANAELLRQAIEEYARTPELARLLNEAEAFRRQGNLLKATERAQTAVSRFPEEPAAYACLARLSMPGHWQEAVRLCGSALKLPGADIPGLNDLCADAYEVGGQHKMAAVMRDRAATARKNVGRKEGTRNGRSWNGGSR